MKLNYKTSLSETIKFKSFISLSFIIKERLKIEAEVYVKLIWPVVFL